MDTTDPKITFDKNGICSHCHYFDKERMPNWFPNEKGKKILDEKIATIKKSRQNHQYDCMIGLSGEVDSSYLAYVLKKEYNLRMLAVHVDAGWNSELAVSNIENIVKNLELDLYTHVVDWQEMKSLQVAFLKSGVVNQDTPQDHAFFAGLYMAAEKFGIKDFLVGQNIQTESILPKSWQGLGAMDTIQLKYINNKFGTKKLKNYPTVSLFNQHIYYPRIYKFKKLIPLNYMPYNKDDAKEIIINELGWRDYGVKHGESKWTKFFQSYFLTTKCGFDKRRAHLSSLVLAKEISRKKALIEIEKTVYNSNREIEDDKEYIVKKLGITRNDLNSYLDGNCIHYSKYPNAQNILLVLRKIKFFVLRK
jgi:N-acetyl sugar amidotransferase